MIPINELQFICAHSSGPGGQGVNTASSAVILRWNYRESSLLDEEAKTRFTSICGRRATEDGVVIIEATEFRSQLQNRRAALERLEALVEKALTPPKHRRKTRVPNSQKKMRREAKARRSQRLKDRRIGE